MGSLELRHDRCRLRPVRRPEAEGAEGALGICFLTASRWKIYTLDKAARQLLIEQLRKQKKNFKIKSMPYFRKKKKKKKKKFKKKNFPFFQKKKKKKKKK